MVIKCPKVFFAFVGCRASTSTCERENFLELHEICRLEFLFQFKTVEIVVVCLVSLEQWVLTLLAISGKGGGVVFDGKLGSKFIINQVFDRSL